MKSRERMLDATIEANKKVIQTQHRLIEKLKVKNAELEILARSIRDAINIQLDGGNDEPKQQKA